MPNWCSNTLIVSGTSELLKEFEINNTSLKNNNDCLSFSRVISQPPDVDWYKWNCENWGTKWDVSHSRLVKHASYYKYDFDTAWSPPIQWLEKCAKKYPWLKFELLYCELDMLLYGYLIYEHGRKCRKNDEGLDYLEKVYHVKKKELIKYIQNQENTDNIFDKFPGLLHFFNKVYRYQYDYQEEFLDTLMGRMISEGTYTYLENYLVIPLQSKVRQHIARKRFLKKQMCNELEYLPPKTNFAGGIHFQLCETSFNSYSTPRVRSA
jgi:hypothetical protein